MDLKCSLLIVMLLAVCQTPTGAGGDVFKKKVFVIFHSKDYTTAMYESACTAIGGTNL